LLRKSDKQNSKSLSLLGTVSHLDGLGDVELCHGLCLGNVFQHFDDSDEAMTRTRDDPGSSDDFD
jgi:hypothetical protein